MSLSPIRTAMGIILAALLVAQANAAYQHPSGLSQGDEYRVVFVTTGTVDATLSDIDFYNRIVTYAASASDLVDLGTTWRAIASTDSVNARVNTMTEGSGGVPIYRVDGVKVADDYSDLWDGNIDAAIVKTETGAERQGSAWTGTYGDGTTWVPLGGSGASTGATYLYGYDGWVKYSVASADRQFHLYAISGVLTAEVPVPAAAWLFGSGLLGLGFIKRKRS